MTFCSKCNLNSRRDDNSWCQPCLNQARRDWEHKGGGRRFLRYRLTDKDLYYMWLFQGGRCDICKSVITIDKCHVDHDTTCCSKAITRTQRSCGNCVRGLLCGSCNQGLGNFKDNTYRLKEATMYLIRTGGE